MQDGWWNWNLNYNVDNLPDQKCNQKRFRQFHERKSERENDCDDSKQEGQVSDDFVSPIEDRSISVNIFTFLAIEESSVFRKGQNH